MAGMCKPFLPTFLQLAASMVLALYCVSVIPYIILSSSKAICRMIDEGNLKRMSYI